VRAPLIRRRAGARLLNRGVLPKAQIARSGDRASPTYSPALGCNAATGGTCSAFLPARSRRPVRGRLRCSRSEIAASAAIRGVSLEVW